MFGNAIIFFFFFEKLYRNTANSSQIQAHNQDFVKEGLKIKAKVFLLENWQRA